MSMCTFKIITCIKILNTREGQIYLMMQPCVILLRNDSWLVFFMEWNGEVWICSYDQPGKDLCILFDSYFFVSHLVSELNLHVFTNLSVIKQSSWQSFGWSLLLERRPASRHGKRWTWPQPRTTTCPLTTSSTCLNWK